MHHERFKRTGRRQVWSYLHLINGRLAMVLGMANGAIGLWMARATNRVKAIYMSAAIVMLSIWVMVSAWHEWHRRRESKRARERERALEDEQAAVEAQEQGLKDIRDVHVRRVSAPVF